MDVDPVSGNDIPSGSMAEEVRDDIPAQLSDGEYVVPADVVRYYGVKFFEDLRERAKIGLQDMEMNGRIGGEPVPAGGPMNTQELSPQEMQALQEVMGMYGGGQVRGYRDSSLVTSNLTEQNMLDAGNKAVSNPYIGQDLGFSIFGDSNNQQGVQQTEVKPFTPITLYNTSGQTRTVNSEAEEKLARDDDFTMTLEQYNMYRSQRGGSGGTGGGSGIITPPGQGEDQEVKPWGQDVNWNKVSDIEQFVAQAERGNLSGSGRFLRGAGFAIAGLPGAMLAGAFQVGKGLSGLHDMEAAKIIAEAKGHTKLAKKIDQGITDYLKNAGDIANFLYKPESKAVINKVNGYLKGAGYKSINDVPTIQEEAAATAKKKKKIKTQMSTGAKTSYKGSGNKVAADKVTTITDSDGSTRQVTGTATSQDSVSAVDANDPRFQNKGGLMTKGKKK